MSVGACILSAVENKQAGYRKITFLYILHVVFNRFKKFSYNIRFQATTQKNTKARPHSDMHA